MVDSSYLYARQLCGLSREEAAEYHGVHTDTIKDWDENRIPASVAAWNDLQGLFKRIKEVAEASAREQAASKSLSPSFHRQCPETDVSHDRLPFPGARKAAGVMALMGAIAMKTDEMWEGNRFVVAG